MEFARAAVSFPESGDGARIRRSVPPLITLHAVTHALQRIDEIEPEERALALDRAALLIGGAERDLAAAWAGLGMPESVRSFVEEAGEAHATAAARSGSSLSLGLPRAGRVVSRGGHRSGKGLTMGQMRRAKISIIGAGNVGATCAHWAAALELGDIVVLDIPDREGVAKGKMIDLACCGPIGRFDSEILGTSDYKDIAGSDVVVVTAGLPRKPGMSRDDLIETNVKIVKSVSENIREYAPESIVIVVSNPLDAMVYTAWKATGFPTNRIMGQAGALDVARFRTFIAWEIGCSVEDVQALLLGGHGDDMVPLPRLTSVHGIPITDLLSEEKVNACVERAKVGGGEIVKLMGTSAYYAPAAGTIQMVEAIVKDKKRIIPCAAYCRGEFGVSDLFVGVPALLGAGGVEKIVEFGLTWDEKQLFAESARHVEELVGVVKQMFPELA
jgi:malate dehydrogenase